MFEEGTNLEGGYEGHRGHQGSTWEWNESENYMGLLLPADQHSHRPQGEKVCFLAIVDSGAMINVMDMATYQRVARWLVPLEPSDHTLRMADGMLEQGLTRTQAMFEVKAVQDYGSDSITLPANASMHRIKNYGMFRALPGPTLPTAIPFPSVGQYNPTAPAETKKTPAAMEQARVQTGTAAEGVLGGNDHVVHGNTSEPTLLGQDANSPLLFGVTLAASFKDQSQEQAMEAFHIESGDLGAKKDNQEVVEQEVEISEVHEQSTLEQSDDIFTRLTEKGLFYPP
ncbi:hypothetical protein PISMIDRAFT_21325 [Pisolithus microcarpus 441]|uniref:Uncharacterized protein n=1 Tax=Pisolithus microcarpus 441 TaxID=765257 RepID=A0A0D0AC87_9AGAM|nr:hypothetical protein BKA83DRAFT_21325 [Pisolithus microcarpus]KIK29658.1 hypothetical protein PISMIDRAFT_21325 [Pisolithus microcarpus 441]